MHRGYPDSGRTGKIILLSMRLTISGANGRSGTLGPVPCLSALAVLHPPPEPAIPHGYDFARWAWFQEIGGVGFGSVGRRACWKAPPVPDWRAG